MLGIKKKITKFIDSRIEAFMKLRQDTKKSIAEDKVGIANIDMSVAEAQQRQEKSALKDNLNFSFQKGLDSLVFNKDGKQIAMDSIDNCVKNNKMTGLTGSPKDIVFSFFAKFGFIGWQICSVLGQHWLISKACNIANKDCLRNGWVNVFVDKKDTEESEEEKEKNQEILNKLYDIEQQEYHLNEKLLKWGFQVNQFGVSYLLPKIDGVDYEKPYNPDGITKGSFKGIAVIEPYWVIPEFDKEEMIDPTSINFFNPEYYRTNNGQKIHRSHIIVGRRKFVSDILKPSYYFGGISLAQEMYERVYASERSANEAPLLLLTKRLNVYKTKLKEVFANPQHYKDLMSVITDMRDNQGILFADLQDEISQIDTTLSDLDEVIMKQYQLCSAIAEVPVDKLFETNPTGGLSASGDYNIKNYNQNLNTLQTDRFKPAIDRINEIVMRSSFDKKDRISIVFNSTDNPTEKDIADLNKQKADTDISYIQNGIITPEEARQRLVNDKTSGYAFLKGVEMEEPSEEEQQEIEMMMNKSEEQKEGKDEDDIEWITVKGNHIPIKEGETKEEAIKNFLKQKNEKGEQNKIEGLNEPTKEDTFINVPYSEKDEAKSLGAKWNPEKKSWYIPKGINNEDFCKWYKEQAEENGTLKEIKIEKPKEKEIVRKLADGFVATRETKKAYLIEKEGTEFWVQKRWVREDGTLTKAGEKAYNRKLEMVEKTKEFKKIAEEKKEKLEKEGVSFRKDWENEKSIGTDLLFEFYSARTKDYETYRVRVFIPKSMLNEKGNAPYWLMKKKQEEAQSQADMIASSHTLSGMGDARLISGFDYIESAEDSNNIDNQEKIFTIVDGKIYEIEEK